MEEKQKSEFDAYMKLADFYSMRWNERRKIDIRISIALWIVMAATIYTIKIRPEDVVLGYALAFIILAHAFFVTIPIEKRNQKDIENAFRYTEMAESLLNEDIKPRGKPDLGSTSKTVFSSWWVRFSIATTTVLSFTVYYFIGEIG